MRRMLVYGPESAGSPIALYEVRQGLPYARVEERFALDDHQPWSRNDFNGMTQIRVSPDAKRAIVVNAYNASASGSELGNRFTLFPDTDDFSSRMALGFTFGGQIRAAAATNDYAILGGTASSLNVIEWETGNSLSIDSLGLGTIYGLAVDDSQRYLYVACSGTPLLRRYDLDDFTFIDIDPSLKRGTPSVRALVWTPHGILVAGSNGSSGADDGFILYSADLATKIATAGHYQTGVSAYAQLYYDDVNDQAILLNKNRSSTFRLNVAKLGPGGSLSVNTPINSFSSGDAPWNNTILGDGVIDKETGRFYFSATGTSNSVSTVVGRNSGRLSWLFYYDLDTISTLTNVIPEPAPDDGFEVFNSHAIAAGYIERDTSTITGTVRDVDNLPAARVVRAYRRSDGLLIAQTTSDAVTGNYELILPDEGPFDIQFMTETGELLNDLFFARSQPEML